VSASLSKIQADINRHRHLFDLDRDDPGRKLCKAATDGVQECIANETSPDGRPDNSPPPLVMVYQLTPFP
jgi:hypothetical protein